MKFHRLFVFMMFLGLALNQDCLVLAESQYKSAGEILDQARSQAKSLESYALSSHLVFYDGSSTPSVDQQISSLARYSSGDHRLIATYSKYKQLDNGSYVNNELLFRGSGEDTIYNRKENNESWEVQKENAAEFDFSPDYFKILETLASIEEEAEFSESDTSYDLTFTQPKENLFQFFNDHYMIDITAFSEFQPEISLKVSFNKEDLMMEKVFVYMILEDPYQVRAGAETHYTDFNKVDEDQIPNPSES